MELLVLGGAPIEADSHNGKPLLCAASGGSVKAVKYLLNHGAEVCKHNLELHCLLKIVVIL